MSVAAVLLVKDEADMIARTLRHLAGEVDQVVVADNMSGDGTFEIIEELAWTENLPVVLERDEDAGYRQAAKTTALATKAYEMGFDWVVPCDADELWYSPFGRVGDVLDSLPGHVLFASAGILNHVTTGLDVSEVADPADRLGWRLREVGALPKVACRTSPSLEIGMGNHEAWTTGRVPSGSAPLQIDGQLYIHHYPWRSGDQFLRKIANGARAYAAAPELGPEFGAHWRAFGMPEDEGFEERVLGWFRDWGFVAEPTMAGDMVVFDPAPAPRERV